MARPSLPSLPLTVASSPAVFDFDGVAQITRGHIAEALSFRRIAPDRR
jgi:hypothetical protein